MKNSFIGIMMDDNPGLIAGILSILKSGNGFVPINPSHPCARIDYIVNDLNIEVLMTDRANFDKARQIADRNSPVKHLLCIDSHHIENTERVSFPEGQAVGRPEVSDVASPSEMKRTCYVIYTSGSTGKPKGVPISHRNLTPLLTWFRDHFQLGNHTRVVQNLSYSFDFGVFEILTTILFGGTFYFLERTELGGLTSYADFIVQHDINTLHTTPTLFGQTVSSGRRIPGVEIVHLGGETLTGKLVNDTVGLVSPGCMIYNGYGPTEATINTAIFSLKAGEAGNFKESEGIPIGRPSALHRVYILDQNLKAQPIGVPGELCIAGEGISEGYLNQPELTAEKFVINPCLPPAIVHQSPITFDQCPETPLYRTGDLARWLPDGNIEFLGRIDHQVKIRGFRIEPGEIENYLLSHESVKEAVVEAIEDGGRSKYLAAYLVPSYAGRLDRNSFTAGLREYLSNKLPAYMLPAYFMVLNELPVTTSGKIDRRSLPQPVERSMVKGTGYVAPITETEKQLVSIWQEVLKLEPVGIEDDFFELGGDSILANRIIARVRKTGSGDVSLRSFFENPTIIALSRWVEKKQDSITRMSRASRTGKIPLSFSQERLWFLQQLDKENKAYHVPRVLRIKGDLDVSLFERTFSEIIRRHEILRTVFPTIDGEPVQVIGEPFELKIPVLDLRDLNAAAQKRKIEAFVIEEGQRPFDFEHGPMLRVTVLKLKEDEHLLVSTEHHLVHDGWTQGVMLKEFIVIFTAYLNGEPSPLPELPIQYADFAIRQREYLHGERLKRHLDYWQKKLAGLPPLLELPTDRPRPPVISGRGTMKRLVLSAHLAAALRNFSKENDVTLFMTMLAVFKVLMFRYCGSEDLCIGTGIANRRVKELEGMLGMVINTIALRTQISGDMPVIDVLRRVKTTCLEAYEHQDTPFEKVVEVMRPERSLSYTPIFQVLYSFMDTPTGRLQLPNLELTVEPSHNRTSKFDMNIVVILPVEGEAGEMLIDWEYNTDIFEAGTIERVLNHYKKLLQEVMTQPEKKISLLPMLGASEIRRLLYEWNCTEENFPREKTIYELFANRTVRTPDNTAVVFEERQFTYRGFHERVQRLGGVLKHKGAIPGKAVGLMLERSLEMLIGVFGILRAGCAYLPIAPEYPHGRKRYMIEDSQVSLLLTRSPFRENWDEICECLTVEDLLSCQGDSHEPEEVAVTPGDPVYIIYTSGTTGRPKGTLIEHKSLVNRLNWMQRSYPLTEYDMILQKTPLFFDVSAWEIFWWLFCGASVFLLGAGKEKDSAAIIDAVERYRVTVIHFVPSMLNFFIDYVEELDSTNRISSLRYIFSSGEALLKQQVRSFNRLFRDHETRLVNLYGPTEATVDVTYFNCPTGEEVEPIPIGKPIDNIKIYILGQYLTPQPVGVYGEVCISGVGLARGYLNKPDLTAGKFSANPFEQSGYLYRTGDLARWLPNGQIDFKGRQDHQVKIRGYRIELGEIESQLRNHDRIKKAVVVAGTHGDGDTFLCAYYEKNSGAGEEITPNELKDYLGQRLPAYMIPFHFMRIDRIPLTPNGKIDRMKLPAPRIAPSSLHTAPRDEMEKKLVEIWAKALGVKRELIGIDSNFFHLGGHSLKAMAVAAKILNELKVRMPVAKIFVGPSIRCLVEMIKNGKYYQYTAPRPTEKKDYYALSSAQKRLYILHLMEHQNISYNMPVVLKLEGHLGAGKLEKALLRLTERHESLRTSINTINGEPFQKISGEVSFKIEYFDEAAGKKSGRGMDAREAAVRHIIKAFIRPFDLSQAPLLRVGLIKSGREENVLLVDMHHIITDGTSLNIFVEDLLKIYGGEKLPPMSIQYRDYLVWKQSINTTAEGKENLKAQEAYWLKEFEDEPPVLNLPLDFHRSAVQGFQGERVNFSIQERQTKGLKKLSREAGVTLYMLLLTVYIVLLAKIGGQEDIIIGTVTEGRDLEELSRVIGMFVKTLAIRSKPVGEKRFSGFLQEAKSTVLEAFENQDYPFEELVKTVSLNRDASRNPLFDTIFVLQNNGTLDIEIPGLNVQSYDYQREDSKFDLTLWGVETGEKLLFTFEYRVKLFKSTTISRFVQYFRKIVDSLLERPDRKISQLEWIPEEMKRQITVHFNDTDIDCPADKTIYELFQEQVELNAGTVGILYEEVHLTYRLLNRQANRLARVLQRKQVVSGSIAAIRVEPSIEMIVGVLSILKAGGAFLPIDSTTPKERVRYILKDSSSRLLLTHSKCEKDLVRDFPTINLEARRLFRGDAGNLECANSMDDPAYVIYTSGSTGRPKGVMVEHKSLNNLCWWHNLHYSISSSDHTVKYAGFGFDASVWEIFPYLIKGVCIDVIKGDLLLDIGELNRYFETHRITVGFLPTQVCEQFINLENSSLRLLLTGGDKLKKFVRRDYALTNHYGPTENTVVTTSFKVETGFENIPIGKPIYNTGIYIFGQAGKLQPIGIAGELCISGDGLARGYLNRPGLTAERFIHHPFIKGERLYKTGDLARLLPDGNIEFLGRKDRQVKIRGNRLELCELECHLARLDGIRQAVVLSVEEKRSKEQYLCAYLVTDGELETVGLREKLADTLPAYMIPSIFIPIEKVPLTASGKVNKEALPVPVFESGKKYVAPTAGLEKLLAEIWAEVLEIEEKAIGMDSNFFELGGHSLKINKLVLKIQRELQVKVPMARIFQTPTIRGLAHYLTEREIKCDYKSIERTEKKEYYALSSAQKRLFVLQQMDRESTGYHISNAVMVERPLEIDRLENVFRRLIKRHESLRTSFGILGKESFQRIHREVEFSIEQYEETLEAVKKILYEFIKPFDLQNAPLFRVCSIIVENERHILMLDMHHIISDAISFNLFITELTALYDGKELPPLTLQYRDYSEWQSSRKQQERRRQQEDFWRRQFEGDIPVLNLPTDYPRPDLLDFKGDVVRFEIDRDLSDQIKQFAVKSFVTLNIVLLSAYYVLLSKYTGQEDFVVGMPISGRTHNDFINTIGFFSNMLALRNRPNPNKTFKEFLEEVKGNAINAYENQEAQFDELIWKLKVPRIAGRHPLVETVLAIQEDMGITSARQNRQGVLNFTVFEFQEQKSHFDLMLHITESEAMLRVVLEYRNSLFKRAAIEEMSRCYLSILKQVIRNSNLKLHDILITDNFLRASSNILADKETDFEFD